jgi:transposase InsO family protein
VNIVDRTMSDGESAPEGCLLHGSPVLVSDITFVKAIEGWLYLAVVVDLYSRKIAGWSLARARQFMAPTMRQIPCTDSIANSGGCVPIEARRRLASANN